MVDTLWQAQGLILLALGVAALAMELFCLVDALRYPEQAYAAAGKLTKTWWLVILGVATAVGFVTLSSVLGFGILGVVAAGVYLAGVRPALRAVSPRTNRRGGKAGGNGPYGAW